MNGKWGLRKLPDWELEMLNEDSFNIYHVAFNIYHLTYHSLSAAPVRVSRNRNPENIIMSPLRGWVAVHFVFRAIIISPLRGFPTVQGCIQHVSSNI